MKAQKIVLNVITEPFLKVLISYQFVVMYSFLVNGAISFGNLECCWCASRYSFPWLTWKVILYHKRLTVANSKNGLKCDNKAIY